MVFPFTVLVKSAEGKKSKVNSIRLIAGRKDVKKGKKMHLKQKLFFFRKMIEITLNVSVFITKCS